MESTVIIKIIISMPVFCKYFTVKQNFQLFKKNGESNYALAA